MKALHRQAGRGRSTIKTAAVLLAGALITATTPPTYGAAITFTDWTRVDTTDDVAEGLLGPVTVTLSGGNVSFSWEAFPGFSFPFFTPALAMSEAVELGGPNPPTTYSYTVSFSTPVSNPRIHIGSLASTLVFSAPLVRVSGQADFVVTGDVLSGAFHEHSIPTDSNGTIELPGWFSSFTFTAQALQTFNPFDGIVIQIGATDPCAQGETPQISVEHSASGTWLS